jgi:hypothetical protein
LTKRTDQSRWMHSPGTTAGITIVHGNADAFNNHPWFQKFAELIRTAFGWGSEANEEQVTEIMQAQAASAAANFSLTEIGLALTRVASIANPTIDWSTMGHSSPLLSQHLAYQQVARDVAATVEGRASALGTPPPPHINVCETGFNAGHSAAAFLLAHPSVHYFGLDSGGVAHSKACAAYLSTVFPGRVHMRWGFSTETMPPWIAELQQAEQQRQAEADRQTDKTTVHTPACMASDASVLAVPPSADVGSLSSPVWRDFQGCHLVSIDNDHSGTVPYDELVLARSLLDRRSGTATVLMDNATQSAPDVGAAMDKAHAEGFLEHGGAKAECKQPDTTEEERKNAKIGGWIKGWCISKIKAKEGTCGS